MRATHACLLLLQLLASSDASGRCRCPSATRLQNTTTMLPDNSEESVSTPSTPTTALPSVTIEEVIASTGPSSGPSSGPARMLLDMYDADDIDRELQQDGSSNDTANATDSPAEEEEEEECVCPPEVVSTFTATLSLGSAQDLAALDFDAIKSQLVSSQSWGDDVEMVPVMKIGVEYTLDVDISEAQCKAAVALAFGITEADVECGTAAAAPATAPAPAPVSAAASPASPAPAPGPAPAPAARRLRRLQAVKMVRMSFTDAEAAAAAATASQDTTEFADALATGGVVATVESVSEADVSVELTFTVTADAAIEEPTPESLETAVSTATSITVTAAVSGFEVGYTRMPCSASNICVDNWQLVDGANAIACEGAECTMAEREICCSQTGLTQGGAQGTCVMGSLVSVLLWQFF